MVVDAKQANLWFFLCWLFVSCWLLASALLTQGEYGDGYTTIANGRYLFGDSATHNAQRGPLAALAMWPVELFINWTEWNPVDVRPYHFYSAFLHSLYLLGCWILLKSTVLRGSKHADTSLLLAIIAALLTVAFYAFAPYLSHDIFPGLLFFVMIYLCHRWLNHSTVKIGLLLVLIGTAVTLIKQTYALFWTVLMLYTVLAYILRWDNRRVTGRKFSLLFTLACISAVFSWLVWSAWLADYWPNELAIVKPWLMANMISERYRDYAGVFSQDLYIRNIHNYGICAMLLVMPGLINAFRHQDTRLRMIAICWLLSVVIMQFTTFKEVRYLLFLAPLTAVLIVPIIHKACQQPIMITTLIVLLLIDQFRGWSLAAEQLASTASVNVTKFIEAPENAGRAIVSTLLTFIYIADSPLKRDLYHGIYQLTPRVLYLMYENQMDIVKLNNPQNLGKVGVRPGDRVYWANTSVLRIPPWAIKHNKPANYDSVRLISGDAKQMQLVRQNDRYITQHRDAYVMFIPDQLVGQQLPVISSSGLTFAQTRRLYGDRLQDSFQVIAVMVKGYCQSELCNYSKNRI